MLISIPFCLLLVLLDLTSSTLYIEKGKQKKQLLLENLKAYLLKTAMVKNEKRKQSADREWQPPSNPRAGST